MGYRRRRQTSRPCIQGEVDFYKNANKSANNPAEAKNNDRKSSWTLEKHFPNIKSVSVLYRWWNGHTVGLGLRGAKRIQVNKANHQKTVSMTSWWVALAAFIYVMGLFLRMRNLNLSVTGFWKALGAVESNKDSVRNAMILGYRSDSKRQKQGQEPCRNRNKSFGRGILLQYSSVFTG